MAGKINVRVLDDNNQAVLPSGLEFGISMSRTVPPAQAQLSPSFQGLTDAKYYVWYRQLGTVWNERNVVQESVACATASNIQNLIDDYYQTEVVPAIQAIDSNYQALSELMLTDISFHDFQANNTGADMLAINASEDVLHIDFVKVVGVFVNGVNVIYDNQVPAGSDTVTAIFRDGNTLKWRAAVAGYELIDADRIILLIAD